MARQVPSKQKRTRRTSRRHGLEKGKLKVLLPDTLTPEASKVLRQALHDEPIEKGFHWVLKELSEEAPVLHLTEQFLTRYEEQIVRLRGHALDGYLSTFRVALAMRCLEVLHGFRMQFADKGVNPLFLQTWLWKKMVAEMAGITLPQLEEKIRNSGRKAPDFLKEQVETLLPQTCLARRYQA
ncbi:MAG TPA: hypothetical protein VM492_07625 [Sumerlaeia bacterium]|nr:hypothetical protein [Sumerlaeia bacterium]